MCEQSLILAVGPYSIDMREPVKTIATSREGQSHIKSYRCQKNSQILTAKCIDREWIGAAAKKKGYQKWNAQVKFVTEICSVDFNNLLSTVEVIKTSQSYWFFQEYDADKVLPLADFLRVRSSQADGTNQQKFLNIGQLFDFVTQMAEVFSQLGD